MGGDVKSSYGGAGGWDRRGCATGAPRSANRQGEEQHRHTERGSHTKRDKGKHSRQGGGAQQGRRGNQNSGNREPEWRGWWSVRMGGSDNNRDGLASQPRPYRVPGQLLLNRHQVRGVSRSPDGLFAQQEREPIRGRRAVRGERTYGGRPGQRVEEQGTWPHRNTVTQAMDGLRTEVCGQQKQSNSQTTPATTSTSSIRQLLGAADTQTAHHATLAQPQHTNHWAPRTRKRHQQEHRPQRPTESSDPTQRAKGRTGDCPGPRKGATTRRNVTRGGGDVLRRGGCGGREISPRSDGRALEGGVRASPRGSIRNGRTPSDEGGVPQSFAQQFSISRRGGGIYPPPSDPDFIFGKNEIYRTKC